MIASQPGFKVGKYEMNDGNELLGNLRNAPLGNVAIAVLGEPGEPLQSSVMILASGATTFFTKP